MTSRRDYFRFYREKRRLSQGEARERWPTNYKPEKYGGEKRTVDCKSQHQVGVLLHPVPRVLASAPGVNEASKQASAPSGSCSSAAGTTVSEASTYKGMASAPSKPAALAAAAAAEGAAEGAAADGAAEESAEQPTTRSTPPALASLLPTSPATAVSEASNSDGTATEAVKEAEVSEGSNCQRMASAAFGTSTPSKTASQTDFIYSSADVEDAFPDKDRDQGSESQTSGKGGLSSTFCNIIGRMDFAESDEEEDIRFQELDSGSDDELQDFRKPGRGEEEEEEDDGDDDDDDDDWNSDDEEEDLLDPTSFQSDYLQDLPDDQEAVHIRDFFIGLKSKHRISWKAISDVLKFCFVKGRRIQDLCQSRHLKSLKTMRREVQREMPPVYIDTIHGDSSSGTKITTEEKRLKELKREKASQANPKCRYAVIKTYQRLEDIKQAALKHHPKLPLDQVEVSVDGVDESKTSDYTNLFVSLCFHGCGKVYLWQIYRHLYRGRPPISVVYGGIVEELQTAGLKLLRVVADAKERKIACGMVQCRSYYACGYCLAPGNQIPDKNNPSDTRNKINGIFYESNAMNHVRRNRIQLRRHAETAATSKKSVYGVKERTPLLDLSDFDPIWGVVLDPLHQWDIGVVSDQVHVFFFLESDEDTRRLRDQLQQLVLSIKPPREHDRRMHVIDGSKTKSKEYKFHCLVTFVAIARVIYDLETTSEALYQRVFLILCFVYRALMLPPEKFREVEKAVKLQALLESWQKSFEEAKGPKFSHFNFHTISHSYESRRRTGLPFYAVSTEKYEASYSQSRNQYQRGTMSSGKQVIS